MTHAEALANDHKGFPGRGCPGALAPAGSHPDRRIDRAGAVVESVVTVYHCPDCGHVISIDDTGAVLNCYPRQLARALATALDAKPLLPRHED